MTRLINADELRENMLYAMCGTGYQSDALMEIDMMPTVDAIPIEFIRERMEGYYKNSYIELGACLETLIEDWRKDNV